MKQGLHVVSWALLLALPLLLDLAMATSSQYQYGNQQQSLPVACQPEFQSCYFRNCCNDLVCFTPTSRSIQRPLDHDKHNMTTTCYSERSVALTTTSYDEKLQLLHDFYQDLVPLSSSKSGEQILRMLEKHEHDFAHLVSRLENRYQISFSTLLDKNNKNDKSMMQDL